MHIQHLVAAVVLVFAVGVTWCRAESELIQPTLVLDDFEGEQPGPWWVSSSATYTEAGTNHEGLRLARDGDRGSQVLVAEVDLAGGDDDEFFLTKAASSPKATVAYSTVSFWYRTTGNIPNSATLHCRLRTQPGEPGWGVAKYSDLPMELDTNGQWQHAQLPVILNYPMNVWRFYSLPIIQIGFWIHTGHEPLQVELALDDVTLVEKPTLPATYEPRRVRLPEREGPLRMLLCKHASAGHYGVWQTARELPQGATVDVAKFRGLHLPLEDFPESERELGEYDLIAMVDVDPMIMPPEQLAMLADYVASGGALLMAGGPNSFGNSASFPPILQAILPVAQVSDGVLKEANATVQIASAHPITQGIPERLGQLTQVHQFQAKPEAEVLLRCGPMKPAGWGYYSAGRPDNAVVGASADAHSGKYAATLEVKSFYPDPNTGEPSWIAVSLLQGDSDGYWGPNAYLAKPDTEYRLSFWIKGDVPQVHPEGLGWSTDEALPDARQAFALSTGPIKPDPDKWHQYEGTFRTASDTRKLVVGWDLREGPRTVKPGQMFMVDDVHLTEVDAEPSANLLVNPGVEDTVEVPALVVGTYHQGRVMVLNSSPGRSPSEQSFFQCDFYDDLLRQALLWLAQRESAAGFAEFGQPPSELASGEPPSLEFAAEGQASAARVRIKGGQHELVYGPRPVTEGIMRWEGIALPESSLSRAPCAVEVELLAADEQEVLARRDFEVLVSKSVRLELTLMPSQSQVTEPGKPFGFVVRGDTELAGQPVAAAICDNGGPVFALPPQALEESDAGQAQTQFECSVPELAEGDYRLRATVQIEGEEIIAELPLFIAAPLRWDEFLPVMGIAGLRDSGHHMDEEGMVERARELYDHGFTTISPGPFAFNREALRLGMALFHDYTHYTDFNSAKPFSPCVFAPEYYDHIVEHQAHRVTEALRLPRYFSAKVTDEPNATARTLDYCEHCRAAYRQMFGEELPEWMAQMPETNELPAGDAGAVARRKWAQFLSAATARAFETAQRAKRQAGAQYPMVLTFWPRAYARPPGAVRGLSDTLAWGQHCDLLDFDDYVYFYPSSPKLPLAGLHHGFGYFRAAADYLGKPWGFYVEMDDRNWPYQKNPYNASSELAYTALAQGADYINTFITAAFGTGMARAERWADWGQEMCKVRALGPLLAASHRPLAPVAVIQPYTTQYMTEDDVRPKYAYEYLTQAWGEADVVDERILRERGIAPYQCLVLLAAKWMDSNMAPQLVEFVENGGLLIYDELPEFDENMNELTWPEEMAHGQEHSWGEGMPIERCPYGEGECVRLKFDPEQWCRTAAEEDQPQKGQAFRDAIRKLIDAHGIRPRARCSNPHFEAGVRQAQGSSLLIVVSHAEETEETTVSLHDLAHPVGFVCDMFTGEPVPYQHDGDALACKVRLGSRCGRIIGLYPQRPAAVELTLSRKKFARGEKMKYRLSITDTRGKLIQGSHLVQVAVTDPQGQLRHSYSGQFLCRGGRRVVSADLTQNAPTGQWTISAKDWLGNETPMLTFVVE